jgi:SAM-dependent methyltransferase
MGHRRRGHRGSSVPLGAVALSEYPKGNAYQERFDALAAAGHDVHGEATLVRSYAPGAVLDAGCGTGRVAIELARHGIEVVGVDVDAAMLDTARTRAPAIEWRVGDLASVALDTARFDVAVLAGNVLIFVTPGTEAAVVANVARALRPGGRLIAGFQLRPGGYDLDMFDRDADAAGLRLEDRWSTWDRAPFAPGGDYAVTVLIN